MSLDKKLKRAAFDATFLFFMKTKGRSMKYKAKGIIEAANAISKDQLSEQKIAALSKEFLTLMQQQKEENLKDWVVSKFHLF